MGRVHHARFLEYLEMGRVDLMKKSGISYRELEERGVFFPVLEVWVRYRNAITFDDELELATWYREVTRTRVTFAYRLLAPSRELAAEALTLHAQITGDGRPVPLDERVLAVARPLVTPEDLSRSRLSGLRR